MSNYNKHNKKTKLEDLLTRAKSTQCSFVNRSGNTRPHFKGLGSFQLNKELDALNITSTEATDLIDEIDDDLRPFSKKPTCKIQKIFLSDEPIMPTLSFPPEPQLPNHILSELKENKKIMGHQAHFFHEILFKDFVKNELAETLKSFIAHENDQKDFSKVPQGFVKFEPNENVSCYNCLSKNNVRVYYTGFTCPDCHEIVVLCSNCSLLEMSNGAMFFGLVGLGNFGFANSRQHIENIKNIKPKELLSCCQFNHQLIKWFEQFITSNTPGTKTDLETLYRKTVQNFKDELKILEPYLDECKKYDLLTKEIRKEYDDQCAEYRKKKTEWDEEKKRLLNGSNSNNANFKLNDGEFPQLK